MHRLVQVDAKLGNMELTCLDLLRENADLGFEHLHRLAHRIFVNEGVFDDGRAPDADGLERRLDHLNDELGMMIDGNRFEQTNQIPDAVRALAAHVGGRAR